MTTNILHVITGLGVGGAERSLYNLLTGRLDCSYEHHVVSLTGSGHYKGLLESRGISVHDLDMRVPAGIFRLVALTRRLKPDILHGWMYHGNLGAMIARASAPRRPKLVWGIRTGLDQVARHKRSTRMVIQLGAVSSGSADAIVYNSCAGRQHHEIIGYNASKGQVIPNGFDLNRWKPDALARETLRRQLRIPPNAVVVGFVGRFHAVKDLPNFYTALHLSMERIPDLYCVVVGRQTDAHNPELATHIATIPPARVHHLGQQTEPEKIMPCFDFLCLSSAAEGFPNVVGEAMACGIPCVLTDVGDAAVIAGETGLIVPPRNAEALSDAINNMAIRSHAERAALGRAARERISRKYSLSATLDRYDGLYKDLMAD